MLTKFSGCFYTDRLSYLSAQTEWRREAVTLANIVDWYFAGHNGEDDDDVDPENNWVFSLSSACEDDDVDRDDDPENNYVTVQVTMVKMRT